MYKCDSCIFCCSTFYYTKKLKTSIIKFKITNTNEINKKISQFLTEQNLNIPHKKFTNSLASERRYFKIAFNIVNQHISNNLLKQHQKTLQQATTQNKQKLISVSNKEYKNTVHINK